jgi:hypothetical protein
MRTGAGGSGGSSGSSYGRTGEAILCTPVLVAEDVRARLATRETGMTEYVSGELGGKIKAIICEWWELVGEGSAPAEHLESSDIYERLIGDGVEVPDHAMSEILVELAKGGQIKLTMDGRPSRDPRKYGSMTVRSVKPGLCS